MQWWRKHKARGQVIIVRYADDFIVGFQYKDDAERFHAQLRERLEKFNLKLNEASNDSVIAGVTNMKKPAGNHSPPTLAKI